MQYDADFLEFWSEYPRKAGKVAAQRAFRATKSEHPHQPPLVESVRLFSDAWRTREARFIPHASTWLNGRRWLEAPEPPEPPPTGVSWTAEPAPPDARAERVRMIAAERYRDLGRPVPDLAGLEPRAVFARFRADTGQELID